MKRKHLHLRPNKTVTALLSGQRIITVAKTSDLQGVAEALEGMEEVLFPGTAARRVQTDAIRAATPTEGIIAHYRLDAHLPQTMGIWRAEKEQMGQVGAQQGSEEKAEEMFRQRMLWLVSFIQGAPPWNPLLGEQVTSPYLGCPAGTPFWLVCLITEEI